MRKYILISIALCGLHLQNLSQTTPGGKVDSLKLESLKNRLPSLKGKGRVDLLNEIAARMNFVIAKSKRIDSIIFYAQKAFEEASKIEYKAGIAKAMLNLSYETVQNASDSVKALNEKNIRRAIELGEETNNNHVLGLGYYLLSGIPSIAKIFEKQSDCYKRSAEYFLKAGDTLYAAEVTNWLFDLYFYRGKYEEAFDIGKKALSLSIKISERDISRSWQQFLVQYVLSNMSRMYSVAGDYETAMTYLLRNNQYALDNQTGWILNGEIALLFCDMGNYDSALVYWNLWRYSPFWNSTADGHKRWGYRIRGSIHLGKKEYDAAIDTFTTSFAQMKKKFGFIPPDATNPVAQAYFGKKDYNTALTYARQGLARQEELDVRPQMIETYKLLSSIYHQIGNNDSAYQYLIKYNTLKDSIQNRQFLLRIYNSKKEAEYERNSSQLNLLHKDNQLKEQKLKQQATLKNSLIAGLILLFLLGLFIYRSFYLKRKKQQAENEKKLTELEMQALRAQMNPHFIFNCLSSINRFILKNEGKTASNYLTRFSRLMRMVLMNSQKPLISLDDELQMLEIYLEMERLRFKNSFDYAITFLNAVDSDNVFIPPLLLQPFCENAIWHGLMHKEGQGRLDIELKMEDKILNCTITDNGAGRKKAEEMKSKTAEKEKSMGLKITTERLALLNKEKGLHTFYEIEDLKDEYGKATGTKVILKISYKETIEEIA
jgi:tetratricopeptide (TPR) repeat protein